MSVCGDVDDLPKPRYRRRQGSSRCHEYYESRSRNQHLLYFVLFRTSSSGPPGPMTSFRVSWRLLMLRRITGGQAVDDRLIGLVDGTEDCPCCDRCVGQSRDRVGHHPELHDRVGGALSRPCRRPGRGSAPSSSGSHWSRTVSCAEVHDDLVALARGDDHVRRGDRRRRDSRRPWR